MRTIVLEIHRPRTVALLIAACCLMFALNVHILHSHHKTLPWLVKGLWKYGPIGVFNDPPIPPIRLSDPATFHASCGPGCSMRRGL